MVHVHVKARMLLCFGASWIRIAVAEQRFIFERRVKVRWVSILMVKREAERQLSGKFDVQ
jgi:hypothetical protein